MDQHNPNIVKTTKKSLEILEEIQARGEVTTTELSRALEMNKSTVHKHLATLHDRSYVFQDDDKYYIGDKLFEISQSDLSFRIIDALKEHGRCTVSDLSDFLGVTEISLRSYLNSLVDEGYIIEDGNSYRLSLRFLDIGGAIRNRMDIYRAGEAKVNDLAEETTELVNLVTEDNGKGVYLYQARGENGLLADTYVGCRVYLHTTAFGKAMLAALPDSRVEAIIDQWGLPEQTPNTITDREELFDELTMIRDQSLAFDDEERVDGMRCVASSITTDEDELVGAISVSAPVSRMPDERFEETYPGKILNTVNLIELDINYN